MYRIINVDKNKVRIGAEDGRYFEISSSKLDFAPEIGDVVGVYFNSGEICVVLEKRNRCETKVHEHPPLSQIPSIPAYTQVEERKILPVLICVLAAITLIAGGVFFYVNRQNKIASEYANDMLRMYRNHQDAFFNKNHAAGDLIEIGFDIPEMSDFKVGGDKSFFTIKSQRKMRGCPQGTTWTISNHVTKDYWRTETKNGYRHNFKWILHYACSMVVPSDEANAEEDKKNCEWFVPEFKSVCK